MKKFVLGLFIFINIGCLGQNPKMNSDKLNSPSTEIFDTESNEFIKSLKDLKLKGDSSKSYKDVIHSIGDTRQKLGDVELSKDSLSSIFKHFLVNRIIPFWEGTEWSFEGHTSIPKKGKIACGYFVSTTLQDVGVNINRYRLAQQNPFDEASSLAINSEVIEIAEKSVPENIVKINENLKEGIHFIGFDASHVGYILKENEQLYLIHSNYMDDKGVQIEIIEESDVFASYNKFHITEISTNEDLMKNWIDGTEIQVVIRK